MAISLVSSAVSGNNTTTSFSITFPATQAGDVVVLEFVHRGTGDGTFGGTFGETWTKRHEQLFASSAFGGQTYTAVCSGDHAGETVSVSNLTNSCAAVLLVYRGVDTADPLGAATIVGEENASGNETQAQITTNIDGAFVVLVVANSPDVAVTSPACTSPGALTIRAEKLNAGGTDTSINHSSAEKATAGATGAFTWAQTNGASGSWAYALKPASSTIVEADATASGTASATGPAAAIWNSVSSAAGVAAASVVGAALWLAVAAASGQVTADAPSASVLGAVASSDGLATVAAEGADGAFGSIAAATGVATATGVASAIAETAAGGAGVAVVSGSGATLWLAVAAAPGVAAAAADSAAIAEATAASAGGATVEAASCAVIAAEASSVGAAVATGEGADGASGGQGLAGGVATALAVSGAIAGVDATSAGAASALGAGASIVLAQGDSVGAAEASAEGADANDVPPVPHILACLSASPPYYVHAVGPQGNPSFTSVREHAQLFRSLAEAQAFAAREYTTVSGFGLVQNDWPMRRTITKTAELFGCVPTEVA